MPISIKPLASAIMPLPTIAESTVCSSSSPWANAAAVSTQNAMAQMRNAGSPLSTSPSKVKLIEMAMPMAAPMTPIV